MGLNKKNNHADEVEIRNGDRNKYKMKSLKYVYKTSICRLCLEKKHINNDETPKRLK